MDYIGKYSFVSDLWRVYDGCELVDAEHSQVGDGEGAALELVQRELPLAGLGRKGLDVGRHLIGVDSFERFEDKPV